MTEWRSTAYPGYDVNNKGQVRGKFGRVLKPWLSGTRLDYWAVACSHWGTKSVHVLVCQAFHGDKKPGEQVAHINGNSKDNRPENLRWSTPKANAADKITHGTVFGLSLPGERNPRSVLTEDQVIEIRSSAERNVDLALRFGVSKSTIGDIKKGRSWTHVPLYTLIKESK